MKHFMSLMALAFAFTAGAQGTSIHDYPWNPDSNNDTFIGAEDLMGLLSTYGTQFGLPPEPCTYDGTPLEELTFSIMDGTIILDSIFIEYEIEDISTYYLQGCPDPVTDTVVFAGYGMLDNLQLTLNQSFISYSESSTTNGHLQLGCEYNGQGGFYSWQFYNSSLYGTGFLQDGFFGSYLSNLQASIPFPPAWSLDEDGIHFDCCWNNGWVGYANYLHILPYWHYAE